MRVFRVLDNLQVKVTKKELQLLLSNIVAVFSRKWCIASSPESRRHRFSNPHSCLVNASPNVVGLPKIFYMGLFFYSEQNLVVLNSRKKEDLKFLLVN